jgi:hypothetical protein
MDQTLVEQIDEVVDALRLAEADAQRMKQTVRKQRISFGLAFNQVDGDILHIISQLRYMQQLAKRWEQRGS